VKLIRSRVRSPDDSRSQFDPKTSVPMKIFKSDGIARSRASVDASAFVCIALRAVTGFRFTSLRETIRNYNPGLEIRLMRAIRDNIPKVMQSRQIEFYSILFPVQRELLRYREYRKRDISADNYFISKWRQ